MPSCTIRFAACASSAVYGLPPHSTGKERDPESGNDYFGARYYASSMGRFLSPDWSAKAEPVPYGKLDNPQSLNLYAYVGNNPLSRVDATGHVDAAAQCKGEPSCTVSVVQTVGLYKVNTKTHEASLYSTMKLTTTFNVTTGSNGKQSVAASSSAEYVSGAKLSASQYKTIGSMSGLVQQAAALMGFGDKTTQAMTAVNAAETVFGTRSDSSAPAFKQAGVNPLQLSGGRANMDLEHNVEGALQDWDDKGNIGNRFGNPMALYDGPHGYSNGAPDTTALFDAIYGSITESYTVK